jgi:hypothetical protein
MPSNTSIGNMFFYTSIGNCMFFSTSVGNRMFFSTSVHNCMFFNTLIGNCISSVPQLYPFLTALRSSAVFPFSGRKGTVAGGWKLTRPCARFVRNVTQ